MMKAQDTMVKTQDIAVDVIVSPSLLRDIPMAFQVAAVHTLAPLLALPIIHQATLMARDHEPIRPMVRLVPTRPSRFI